MLKKYLAVNFILGCLLIVSCSNQETTPNKETVPAESSLGEKNIHFQVKDGEAQQTLDIEIQEENKIKFVVNRKGVCSRTLEGVAINQNPDGDPEIDEDSFGESYPVVEYTHEISKECILNIRLDMMEQKKIRMVESCRQICPFEDQVMMRADTPK